MGRGNACVFGKYEGLYYVAWSNFSSEFEWEGSLEQFIGDFTKRFKSFSRCDEWISSSEKAVLENSLFYIVVEDNEWSIAIKLIQKEQGYHFSGNIENLQAKHYITYLNGLRDCLFKQFKELGTYGGPWTSGRIHRTEEFLQG